MDLFEKIGDTIIATGKEAADKAKELAEIASLKGQIATCEEVMKRNYIEIGKLYYEQYGEIPDEAFSKYCMSVKNAKAGAEELKERINDIKGI